MSTQMIQSSTDSTQPALRTRLVTWKEPVVDVAQSHLMCGTHVSVHPIHSIERDGLPTLTTRD
jgi:hypothetical protein